MTISEIATSLPSLPASIDPNFERILNEERIFATGFYDSTGTWFYTWERSNPNADYSYYYVNGRGEEMIRYSRCLRVHGEMSEREFLENGLR